MSYSSATPWTVARQAPQFMWFSGQYYWSGLPFFYSRGFSQARDQTCISVSPALQADSLLLSYWGRPCFMVVNDKIIYAYILCIHDTSIAFFFFGILFCVIGLWVFSNCCKSSPQISNIFIEKNLQISGSMKLTLFFWAPKSLQMVAAAMKLKDAYSLEGKLWPT